MVVVAIGSLDASTAFADSASDRDAIEIAFRQEFGLRSDLEFVRSVRASESVVEDDTYPVPLTADERAEMDRRRVMETHLEAADTYAAQHRAVYGGMYIDQAAGGILDFAFTADVSRHEVALLGLAPPGSTVRVRLVPNTESDLDAVLDTIVRDAPLLADVHGIAMPSIWTDIPANRVAVGIQAYTPENEALLVERYGATVIRVYTAGEGRTNVCQSRANCPGPPLRGGIRIDPAGCTSGFIAHAGDTYQYVLLTAGHCLAPYAWGTYWRNNTTTIGPQRNHSWSQNTDADAGFIDFTGWANLSAWVYRSPSTVDRVRNQQALGADHVGGYVCQSGRVTGVSCGSIKATNANPILSGVQLVRQRYASYFTSSGDSGAPVFTPYAEDMITAYGIQSGVLDSDDDGVQELNLSEWAVYSHIGEVQGPLGVTVYTTCC